MICLTLDALDYCLEKVYEKDTGLRREMRCSRVMGLDMLVGLLQGGVPEYLVVRGLHLLREDVAVMRGGSDRVVDHVVALNRIVKVQQACVDRLIVRFEESQRLLAEAIKQLNEENP